ncbi:hypothetical protein [Natronococcus sp. A-GB7]|uniref:hypothetical protein n=1 Tax=Natronococcus sp. A-GB7 TaxID=3037649 RepID=UPI00242028FE|nr:hypothetical protein [Natronococcus sp. A-GB7]MDG5819748.1 hypothetical protein [Natronococcus sp. A-GB7]
MPRNVRHRAVLAILVACLFLATAGSVGPAVGDGSVAASASTGTTASDADLRAPPDAYEDDRSQRETLSWLSNHLGDRLGTSAESTAEGEFDRALEPIDEGYDARLEQFTTVNDELTTEEIASDAADNASARTDVRVYVPLSTVLGEEVAVTAMITNYDADPVETTVTYEVGDETAEETVSVDSLQTEEISVSLDATELGEGEHPWAVTADGHTERGELTIYAPEERAGNGTEADAEKGPTEAFEDAAADQEAFVEHVREYQRTLSAYETARQEGDAERTRESARALDALAERIDELGGAVLGNYDVIEYQTDASLSEAAGSINGIVAEIREEQAEISDDVPFAETSLEIEADGGTASIVDPVEFTGRLTTTDSAVANEELRLQVDEQDIEVETDDDGEFSVEYRPTATTTAGPATMTVTYVPDPGTDRLQSETTVDVVIEPVDATIPTLETSDAVAYGDDLEVAGEVTIPDADGDVPAAVFDSVPIRVSAGDEPLGEIDAEDGSFDGSVPVPASVAAGEQPLTVRLALEERALTPAEATAPIDVAETATDIEFEAVARGDEVALNGALETTTGDPVENQSVTIDAEDGGTATVTTDVDGAFSVSGPELTDGSADGSRIAASYDGTGTNLGDATFVATVTAPGTEASGTSPFTAPVPAGISVLEIVSGIGLLVVVVGVLWFWGGRNRRALAAVGDALTGGRVRDSSARSTRRPNPSLDGNVSASTLLSLARTRRERGDPDLATRIAYAAVRRAYDSSFENARGLTHREFYRVASERAGDERIDERLRTVTEAYERAAFGTEPVSDALAERVLSYVADLCRQFDADRRIDADD